MNNYIDLRQKNEPNLQHVKNIFNTNEIKTISACPLCNSKQFLVTGRIDVNYLIANWIKTRNFNPIPLAYLNKKLEQRLCKNCNLTYYNYSITDCKQLYDLLATHNYYPAFRPEFEFVINFLNNKKIKSVLEVGCGGGGFLDKIQNYVPLALGSEYSQTAIKICKQKNLNVTDEKIENIKSKFHVVCSFEVAEHVNNLKEFMQSCLNKVDKNGYLIISTPNPNGVLNFVGDGILDLPPHHQCIISKKTFEYLAKIFNLKLTAYYEAKLTYAEYENYVKHITHKNLESPDIAGFNLTSKTLSGHSHVVIFKKIEPKKQLKTNI